MAGRLPSTPASPPKCPSLDSMAAKLLRLNATVSDGRIIVSFSYPPAAASYREFLARPENAYSDRHDWEAIASGAQVSMALPPDVAYEFPDGSKDAVLVFPDEARAARWQDRMMLWERPAGQAETRRVLSRSLTVGRIGQGLGAPMPICDRKLVHGGAHSRYM